MNRKSTRRTALTNLGVWAVGSPLLAVPQNVRPGDEPKLEGEPPGRITPLDQAVNVFEVEAMAQRKLAATVYATIAGGDRQAFDRILLRPRRFVNVEHLDLTADLFGEKMFTPVIVGPAAHQQAFDTDGELAMVRGAAKAKATVVISSRSSQPIEKIAAEAKTTLWYQVYPENDMAPVLNGVKQAVKVGCKVVCVTVGTPYRPMGADGAPNPAKLRADGNPHMSWAIVDQVLQAVNVPVVLKGIMNAHEAHAAVDKGIQGIIVSNHGGSFVQGLASPIEVLASVVDAVGSKAPVLVDGGFRRGTDIVKALAFGARAVLATRPALWGLAAYGSDGVETAIKMLQSETARTMGNCCKVTLASLDRTLVRVVRR
jgi:4-hydroxymandelate oxidase